MPLGRGGKQQKIGARGPQGKHKAVLSKWKQKIISADKLESASACFSIYRNILLTEHLVHRGSSLSSIAHCKNHGCTAAHNVATRKNCGD